MTAKILIIEDEAVIRRELQILLENAMYRQPHRRILVMFPGR